MKVLFLGTSGQNKSSMLDSVRKIAERSLGSVGSRGQDDRSYIEVYDVDKKIQEKKGMGRLGFTAFLDMQVLGKKRALWHECFQEIVDSVDAEKPRHVFVSMHGAYLRRRLYFSCLDLGLIRSFAPDVIITMIDDVYDVVKEISRREKEEGRTASKCSLLEALEWRSVETMIGGLVSSTCGSSEKAKSHFVVPSKASPETVFRLLFERWRLVIYSAYPISSTRTTSRKLKEINEYRRELSKRFTVFDPAYIDELLVADRKTVDDKGFIANIQGKRALLRRLPVHADKYKPKDLPIADVIFSEMAGLERHIKSQIVERDLGLVDQTQLVTAYRPYWGGVRDPSSGVDSEMLHAEAEGKPVYVVHNEKDGDPETMFRGIDKAIRVSSLDALLTELQSLQEKRNGGKQITTWEGDP
jgi:hypothetical protein